MLLKREFQAEIDERRQIPNPEREDILSLMMSARDEQGQPMSNIELKDEMITLILAGYETTTIALAWALYWVHANPDVRSQILDELATLGDAPNPTAIAHLPYLTAVCQETLRISTVVPISLYRSKPTPFTLGKYTIPANVRMAPCIYLLHRRADLYWEPEKFKPERFLEQKYSPYEYLPFGGSNRRCLGYALAEFEMKLVLATVLTHYELDLVETTRPKIVRRSTNFTPHNGIIMQIIGNRE